MRSIASVICAAVSLCGAASAADAKKAPSDPVRREAREVTERHARKRS